jgi:hypothetical protein
MRKGLGIVKKSTISALFMKERGWGVGRGSNPQQPTIELPTPFSVVVRQTLPVLFHFGKKKMSLMSFLNGIFSQLYNKNMIGRLFVSHLENYGETVWSSIAPSWI